MFRIVNFGSSARCIFATIALPKTKVIQLGSFRTGTLGNFGVCWICLESSVECWILVILRKNFSVLNVRSYIIQFIFIHVGFTKKVKPSQDERSFNFTFAEAPKIISLTGSVKKNWAECIIGLHGSAGLYHVSCSAVNAQCCGLF